MSKPQPVFDAGRIARIEMHFAQLRLSLKQLEKEVIPVIKPDTDNNELPF